MSKRCRSAFWTVFGYFWPILFRFVNGGFMITMRASTTASTASSISGPSNLRSAPVLTVTEAAASSNRRPAFTMSRRPNSSNVPAATEPSGCGPYGIRCRPIRRYFTSVLPDMSCVAASWSDTSLTSKPFSVSSTASFCKAARRFRSAP